MSIVLFIAFDLHKQNFSFSSEGMQKKSFKEVKLRERNTNNNKEYFLTVENTTIINILSSYLPKKC